MDDVELSEAALLDHSMRCQIATHVAQRHPRRVTCLVLASPSRDPQAPRRWQQALRLLRDAPRESAALVPIAISDYLRTGPIRMWRTLGDAMGSDAARRLPRIEHRTLVVRGDRDVVISAEWARAVATSSRRGGW